MTGAATTADAGADTRWLAWQARGAAADRLRTRRAGAVTVFMAIALTAAVVFQLLFS